MTCCRTPLSTLALLAVFASCGGGSSGPKPTPITPNAAPVMQIPSQLSGAGGSFTLTLPLAATATLQFTATDADSDPLTWQVIALPSEATAVGITLPPSTPGYSLTLPIAGATAPSAANVVVLVEDTENAAAAIDILVIRTGDPTITGVAPNSAFAGNPQKVTITGSALSLGGTANTRARFAGALASFINIVSDTTLECETPASLAAGPAVVSVENANGGSALPASAFTGYAYPATFLAADAAIDPLSTAAVSDLAIARDGSVVHATWLKDGNVAHCVSVDGGATWSPDQTLNGIDSPAAPQVVVSGANVIVLWIANGTSVVARRSSDGGVAFGAPEILNPLAGSAAATRLRVTGDGDYRYAAWLSGTSERVVVTSSSDGGVSWSSPVPVDDGGARQAEHELVSQGANAWITFTDERQGAFISGAYSARTSDGGGTWSAAVLRSSPLTAISSPRIAADGEDVHIVWLRGGELRYAASTNGGGAFAPPQTLANAMNGGVSAPAVACDKNRMFATFVDGGNSVWVSAVTATGSLPQNQQLSTLTAAAGSTAVIVRDNYVFATWRSGSVAGATARIRFTTSTDQGQSFLPAAAFGDGAASQDLPALAIDGARMLFCWLDYRGAQPAFFFNHN